MSNEPSSILTIGTMSWCVFRRQKLLYSQWSTEFGWTVHDEEGDLIADGCEASDLDARRRIAQELIKLLGGTVLP